MYKQQRIFQKSISQMVKTGIARTAKDQTVGTLNFVSFGKNRKVNGVCIERDGIRYATTNRSALNDYIGK